MTKKQELIDYVIGNEFITKPSLQDKFTKLLDEAIAEQLILHDVIVSFVCDVEEGTHCKNPDIKYKTGVCRNCGGQAN